ncbi:hypothetical protein [Nocardia sp. NPDC047038]|uniref:hypothetical protein n=1 Tax=Nocardia sp. NPDC047038 TaxID=3154338 RepID=UPI0034063D88
MPTVRRFWIEFDGERESNFWVELWQGVGVTGFDERDCLSMVADLLPRDAELPPVRRITVDISLAQRLRVNPPTLGVPVWRGVWYPPWNLRTGPTWRPRGVDRAIAPRYPKPITDSPAHMRAGDTLGPRPVWWDEIPHADSLLWPVGNLPYTHLGEQMWRYAPVLRAAIANEPSYGDMVREALDYVIARGAAPSDWFDPNTTRFLDRQEQDEYLRAFRDYLFGHRPQPIYPPGPGRLPLDAGQHDPRNPRSPA